MVGPDIGYRHVTDRDGTSSEGVRYVLVTRRRAQGHTMYRETFTEVSCLFFYEQPNAHSKISLIINAD